MPEWTRYTRTLTLWLGGHMIASNRMRALTESIEAGVRKFVIAVVEACMHRTMRKQILDQPLAQKLARMVFIS